MESEIFSKFIRCCRNGQLEQAKEIYHSNNIDIHANNDSAFRRSCRKGHIDVAQWLHSLDTFQPAIYKFSFGSSCQMGHLNVAQWLYSLGNINLYSNTEMYHIPEADESGEGNVNIIEMMTDEELERSVGLDITFNEWLLGTCCVNGHLNVAQWLWELDDIHKARLQLNGCIFRGAVDNGDLKIVKWLYSLGKIDINNEINEETVTYVFTYSDHTPEDSDTESSESESSESESSKKIHEIAKWLIFIGIKPDDDHELYPYYRELKRKQFRSLVTLCVFVLKTQRKCKEYWYNPDDGVLMLRAKTEFEILQKKLNQKLTKVWKV